MEFFLGRGMTYNQNIRNSYIGRKLVFKSLLFLRWNNSLCFCPKIFSGGDTIFPALSPQFGVTCSITSNTGYKTFKTLVSSCKYIAREPVKTYSITSARPRLFIHGALLEMDEYYVAHFKKTTL